MDELQVISSLDELREDISFAKRPIHLYLRDPDQTIMLDAFSLSSSLESSSSFYQSNHISFRQLDEDQKQPIISIKEIEVISLSKLRPSLFVYNQLQQLFKGQMNIQVMSLRIDECIDDLSSLLDHIHRFPQKQRENYFQQIQSLRNRLLHLKSGLRQTNAANTQKQYKQIYLAMNSLKNQVNHHNNLICAPKENKDAHNRIKQTKQTKKNYEDAMKLIARKEEQISALKRQLFEKDELIRINFEEINSLKNSLDMALEENRLLKFDQTALHIDLQTAKICAGRTEDGIFQYRIREQEKDKAFMSAVQQLQRLKSQLIGANEKISHYERLAQISIQKTKTVEQNIRKVQREAQDLNDNYRMKEGDHFRQLRQIGELQYELNSSYEHIKQVQHQNRRLKEDIQVLENEISQFNQATNDQKAMHSEQKNKLFLQIKKLNMQIESASIRQRELKKIIQQGQKKYHIVVNSLNNAEEYKIRSKQLEIRNEALEERLKRCEINLQESKRQCLIFLREKQRSLQQLEVQQHSSREVEIQLFKMKQRIKMKDEERCKLILQLENYQHRLKQNEKNLIQREVALENLEHIFSEEKTKIIKVEEKLKIKEKQIENLKIKILRAKIQTIHEIREVIN